FETNLSKKSDDLNASMLKTQLMHFEKYNRELKDKMGFLRLENIRLKKEIDASKDEYDNKISQIKIVEDDSNLIESKNSLNHDLTINKNQTFQMEFFNNVELICPICEIHKTLKIPSNIFNPSQKMTKIYIPKELVCDHGFQILIDKDFIISRYQLANYETNKIEFSHNGYFTSDIFLKIRNFIDDREILGALIFDHEMNVIFASVPSGLYLNLFKEFHLRKERQIQDISKMYVELENRQKWFLEKIEILGFYYILGLFFSKRINFGMGTMLFKDVQDKLVSFILSQKDGII
ncbi:MAG: hypothetical protein ACFFFY_07515, partial [Promethearchaeota archaeon]